MNPTPDHFIFFQVSSKFSSQAFAFHKSIASTNAHIWPRTETQIKKYAEDGELFAVRKAACGTFVGLCYATLVGEEWEIGGLAVDDTIQKHHLGSILVRFALAHTISFQSPWAVHQHIIAYVHEENPKPRNLLARLEFEHDCQVKIPGTAAPPSMKRDADGNVVGDKFKYPPKAVAALAKWFDRDLSDISADESLNATFDCGPGGFDGIRETLRAVAQEQTEK